MMHLGADRNVDNKEDTPFDDELSLFAKHTDFSEFECTIYALERISDWHEELIQELSD